MSVSFTRTLSVKDIMKNPTVIQSIGINKHIIKNKYMKLCPLDISNAEIKISEKLYPLILKTYLTCDFVFIRLPKYVKTISLSVYVTNIDSVNNINTAGGYKVLETHKPKNGIVRFKTFAYSVREDPLFMTGPVETIKFVISHSTSRSRKKSNILKNPFTADLLFNSLSVPKYIAEHIEAGNIYSILPIPELIKCPEDNPVNYLLYSKKSITSYFNSSSAINNLNKPYTILFDNNTSLLNSNTRIKKIFDI